MQMQWLWSSCWELVHGGDLFDYVIVNHMMPNPSAATPSSSDLRIVLHYNPWTNSEQGFYVICSSMSQWLCVLHSRKLYNSQQLCISISDFDLILNADLNITTPCTSPAPLLKSKAKQNTPRVIENEHARI